MSVYFSSDWHLGHIKVAELRGYTDDNGRVTLDTHDADVIKPFLSLAKRDKLFLLGDVAWSHGALERVADLRCDVELIFGNHDQLGLEAYQKFGWKLHGCRRYKKLWLTHIPIHMQEMYRVRGNLHGHIHKGAATPNLDYPYFNVGIEFNGWQPVHYDSIDGWFKTWESRRS